MNKTWFGHKNILISSKQQSYEQRQRDYVRSWRYRANKARARPTEL